MPLSLQLLLLRRLLLLLRLTAATHTSPSALTDATNAMNAAPEFRCEIPR